MCGPLGVSRSGFRVWLIRPPLQHAHDHEVIRAHRTYRTYGARRVWHDLLTDDFVYSS